MRSTKSLMFLLLVLTLMAFAPNVNAKKRVGTITISVPYLTDLNGEVHTFKDNFEFQGSDTLSPVGTTVSCRIVGSPGGVDSGGSVWTGSGATAAGTWKYDAGLASWGSTTNKALEYHAYAKDPNTLEEANTLFWYWKRGSSAPTGVSISTPSTTGTYTDAFGASGAVATASGPVEGQIFDASGNQVWEGNVTSDGSGNWSFSGITLGLGGAQSCEFVIWDQTTNDIWSHNFNYNVLCKATPAQQPQWRLHRTIPGRFGDGETIVAAK